MDKAVLASTSCVAVEGRHHEVGARDSGGCSSRTSDRRREQPSQLRKPKMALRRGGIKGQLKNLNPTLPFPS